MWYKYVNRQTDEMRVWRRANLKFNQDDMGMFKTKYIGKFNDRLFRIARTEGMLRGAGTFLFVATMFSVGYIKSTWYDPIYTAPKLAALAKEEEENNRNAKQTLYQNRVNAPSRPARSIQDMMIFLVSAESISRAIGFISYDGASSVNSDQQMGLDSWMTDEDTKMLDYYQESLKRKSHH